MMFEFLDKMSQERRERILNNQVTTANQLVDSKDYFLTLNGNELIPAIFVQVEYRDLSFPLIKHRYVSISCGLALHYDGKNKKNYWIY